MKTTLERFKDFSAPVCILRILFPFNGRRWKWKKRLTMTPNIREMCKKISASILWVGKASLEIINKLRRTRWPHTLSLEIKALNHPRAAWPSSPYVIRWKRKLEWTKLQNNPKEWADISLADAGQCIFSEVTFGPKSSDPIKSLWIHLRDLLLFLCLSKSEPRYGSVWPWRGGT